MENNLTDMTLPDHRKTLFREGDQPYGQWLQADQKCEFCSGTRNFNGLLPVEAAIVPSAGVYFFLRLLR